jgi:hypothetical protein
MAFVIQNPETFTVTRLRQVGLQTREIQDHYLDRIEIHMMNHEKIN